MKPQDRITKVKTKERPLRDTRMTEKKVPEVERLGTKQQQRKIWNR